MHVRGKKLFLPTFNVIEFYGLGSYLCLRLASTGTHMVTKFTYSTYKIYPYL
jgi:hypothetical protein